MRMCFAAALLATVSLASVAQAQERFEVVLASARWPPTPNRGIWT